MLTGSASKLFIGVQLDVKSYMFSGKVSYRVCAMRDAIFYR